MLIRPNRPHSSPFTLNPRTWLAGLLVLASTFLAGAQSVNQWNTTTSPSSWGDINSWSLGVVPGAADTAAFTNLDLPADTTITLDGNQNIASLIFGDLVTNTAASWLINTGSVANATLTLSGASPNITLTTLANGKSVQFNTPVAGAGGVSISGPGTLFFNLGGGGLWTGGTVINQSTVGLGGAVGTVNQLGGGTVILTNGGTLNLNGNNSSTQAGNFTNPIVVPFGTTGTLNTPGRGNLTSSVTVHGTLNLITAYVRDTPSGDWSASDGQINITGTASGTAAGGDIYLTTTANYSFGTAAMNFGPAAGSLFSHGNFGTGGILITIGEVSGTTGGLIGGDASAANNRITTFVVGGRNTTASFSGTIRDNSRPAAILKMGTGNWILGAANNYSGTTLISTGAIYGVTGGAISNSVITVATNLTYGAATFGVQVASAGGQWTGTNLVLRSGSALAFNFGTVVPSTNVAPLRLLGGITSTNTVTLNVLGGSGWVAGAVYPLAKYASNYVGTGFSAFSLGTLPLRVVGVLSNDTANSQIDLVVSAVNEPLKWAAGSSVWDLNTTANWKDATGATATYQEQIGLGDQTVFDDTASGPSPVTVTLGTNVSPGSLTVSNSAIAYTFAGNAGIGGTTALTKQGAGTLTVSSTNTFTGSVNLNGGILNFTTLTNLGAGTAVNFNGGTLQYAAGSTADISTRTVTIATNGATIDTGGNSVTYSRRIGNNGLGGLTKIGSGILTLVSNSTFSGLVQVKNGTLALGASLSNSVGIVISTGATLDASGSPAGLSLNGVNSQVLAGSGTIAGAVTTAAGVTLTPGTNGVAGTLTLLSDLNLNGGNYVFDVGTTSHDLIKVGGVLNILNPAGGTLTINPLNTLTNGVYKLFQYTNGYNAGLAGITVAGSQAGKIFTLSDATSGEIDLVVSSASSLNVKWVGDNAANLWDIDGTANWLSSGSLVFFDNGDNVTFDDTGSLSPAVSIPAAVSPSSVLVNTINTYNITGSKITGSGTSLTKNGSGTLILANAGNDFGGATVINAGTLQIGDGSTGGTSIGVGPITDNGLLEFNQPDNSTVAGLISGSGLLTALSSNPYATLTLLGNNTYAGLTTVDTGALQVGNGGLSGLLGTNAVSLLNGGTLIINRAGSYSLLNGISGNGQLAIGGPATVTFGGANSYLNNTIITNGTVILAAGNVIPAGGSTTGWLVMDGGATAGILDLNGHDQTVNELSGLGGTVTGQIVNNGSSLNTLTIGTIFATTAYAGLIKDNNNSGSGKIALTVTGDGSLGNSLTLSGANSYSGPVLIDGAKVIMGGSIGTIGQQSIGTGPITLQNGGALQMNGYGSANQSGNFANSILVPAGMTGSLFTVGRGNYTGNITVHGTLNLTTSYVRSSPTGDWSASDGQINIMAGTLGGDVFLSNAGNINFGTAAIDLGSGVSVYNSANTGPGGNTITIGELTGYGTISDTTAGTAGRVTTYVVGGRNTSATFSGTIVNRTRVTAINKVGSGAWTLAGTDTYTGATTVSAGSLVVNNGAFMAASTLITVNSGTLFDVSSYGGLTFSAGQTLAGSGSVSGPVTLVDTDTLLPGSTTNAGTLTFLNNLTLAGTGVNVTNLFSLSSDPTGVSKPNSKVVVNGDLTLTGTSFVAVNALNTILGAGTYTLFTYTGNLINESGVVPPGTTLGSNLAATGAFATGSDATLIFSNAVGSVVMIVQPTGKSLTWVGSATNNWDINVTTNWLTQSLDLTNFLTYDSVNFGNSANTNLTLIGNLAPGAITVNSSSNYVFAGAGKLTATTGLTKSGNGMLTLANTGGNDYTGTVTINGGTLKAGVATALGATNGATIISGTGALDVGGFTLGAEPVTVSGAGSGTGAILNSGAAQLNALQYVTLAGDTTFGGGIRWDIRANTNGSLAGNGFALTKTGTNDIYLVGLGNTALGNVLVQAGRIGLQDTTSLGTSGSVTLSAGAGLDLWSNTVVNTKPVGMNGATFSSSSGTNFYGGTFTLNGNETITAGSALTLNGALTGAGNLTKNGASTLTLLGTNTYTGGTTVSAGSLILGATTTIAASPVVDLSAASASLNVSGLAAGTLTLSSAQTLKGLGSVLGSVTVPAGATISPGETVGTLTVTNVATLGGNAILAISKGVTNANSLLTAAAINYGGTLTITNLGAAFVAGDSFKLFTATSGAYTGSFAGIVPATPGDGLLWSTNNLATGFLGVVAGATVNTNPPPIATSFDGTHLILSWPTNTGWTLQVQTNSLAIGLSNNWVSVPGSASVNGATNVVDPTKGSVFYRLVYTNTP